MRWAALLLVAVALGAAFDPSFLDLAGTPHNPFADMHKANVLVFVRTDCPITNRYAPELARIAQSFENQPVAFWLVYPDRSESAANIQRQVQDFRLPGTPLLDPKHLLVAKAKATVAPEAALFDATGQLRYRGRIDNRWVAPGQSRPAATIHDLEDAVRAVLHHQPVKQFETAAVGCALTDIE